MGMVLTHLSASPEPFALRALPLAQGALQSGQPLLLEVDGRQHYSINGKASPELYAQMVSEDRQLKLSGYEVYRFGGHELDRSAGPRIVAGFFRELFGRYDIPLPPTVPASSS